MKAIVSKQIEAIDCELSIYRKGCITIHVDLQNSLVTWRESKQWCNSFTRTVSEKSMIELESFIQTSSLLTEIMKSSHVDEYPDTHCQIQSVDQNDRIGSSDPQLTTDTNTANKNNPLQRPNNEQADYESDQCLLSSDEQFMTEDFYQYVDQSKSSWQIIMISDQGHFTQSGRFPLPRGWSAFQRMLEKVSRAPFRLF